MTKQSEALMLVEELIDFRSEGPYTTAVLESAAAELRRLEIQRDALLEALKFYENAGSELSRLVAQRDQLLTALKALLPVLDKAWDFDGDVFGRLHNDAVDADARARAAIKSVE